MGKDTISCLSLPVTIVFVDDDKKFLERVTYLLGSNNFFKLFIDPKEALQFLQTYKPKPFTTRCITEIEDQAADIRTFNVEIRSIRNEVLIPNRFAEIGIVILDFAMPDINGGELAKQLQDLPFKVILLTGEADTKIAVDLFNQGAIDFFIRKDDPDFKNLLQTTIRNLQNEYFQEHSEIIQNSLAQYVGYPHTWFKDPEFIKVFNQLCFDNNLIEHYLLDEYGGYLFLNRQGKTSILAVTTDEMMDSYLDYAKDDEAPTAIIEGLKSRTLMPFFFSDDDFNVRAAQWDNYMHPAKTLKGEKTYYYAYITDTAQYKLNTDKIVSFADFLRKQE